MAESQVRIDEAKRNAADIAARMAAEFGGNAAPAHTKFMLGTPEWSAVGEMLRIAGKPEVQSALRSCGFAEDHLQTLNCSIAAVQAAGAEQARRANEANIADGNAHSTEPLAKATGHRPAGTGDAAAQMVAGGNAEQLAHLQQQLDQ